MKLEIEVNDQYNAHIINTYCTCSILRLRSHAEQELASLLANWIRAQYNRLVRDCFSDRLVFPVIEQRHYFAFYRCVLQGLMQPMSFHSA